MNSYRSAARSYTRYENVPFSRASGMTNAGDKNKYKLKGSKIASAEIKIQGYFKTTRHVWKYN